MHNPIWSVKDLTKHIKRLLEEDPSLGEVWVKGEISNFTHHSRGHMYFTLKDEEARVKAIMFAGNNQRLKFIPKNGMRVLVKGYISLYERDGQYQLYVQEMQPDGLGSLFLAYEQLKTKLEAEGLFHVTYKKQIPGYPKVIGVITSPTGAAIRDILTTLYRRYPIVQVLVFPVLVQGDKAAPSIAKAIEILNLLGEVDLLIVGRGGGSLEELWAFNEEIVVRSIFASRIPVISAVGHETDVTLADFVADVRAATPTAAAELAVPHLMELKRSLARMEERLQQAMGYRLHQAEDRLKRVMRSNVFRRPRQQLEQYEQRLDRLQDQLVHSVSKLPAQHRSRLYKLEKRLLSQNPQEKLNLLKQRLGSTHRLLVKAIQQRRRDKCQLFQSTIKQLDALSPLKIMDRGYSLVYQEKKSLVKSVRQVNLGDILKVQLKDGELDCQVWSMEVKS